MRTIIPFTPRYPKSRLGGLLSGRERRAFARVMLNDVLTAVDRGGGDPVILTTESIPGIDWPQQIDERSLSTAVNAVIDPPVAVIMADLALLTPATVERFLDTPGDIVIAPGRGGGTNALVIRSDRFEVDYHGNSLEDHRRIAMQIGLSVSEVDSLRLSTDVDEPSDLVEVLLHGRGETATWLGEQGIVLHETNGRVTVTRIHE